MNATNGNIRQRQAILRGALSEVGYSDPYIQLGWQVSNTDELRRFGQDQNPQNWPEGKPWRLDLVAFHDEREHNWATTAFAAEVNRPDLLRDREAGARWAKQVFDTTAAPNVLFGGNGSADLWLKCWLQPQLVRDIPFTPDALKQHFRKHRSDLDREALARLRGGQHYLFDGICNARREELAQFLHRGVSKATWLSPILLGKERKKDREALSRIAIGLLAARILEDKGFFRSRDQTTDAREILHRAEQRANGFFQTVIARDLANLDADLGTRQINEMLRCLMAHLTGPASFSMVTPEMLGHLYETALVAEREQSRDSTVELDGIHYTPRSLARHILGRIPLEELPPSQRYVLDMACGSGSFLLAGTQRLEEVFDGREADAEASVTEHLGSHVIGNDTDEIARLVTRLAYLLEHWVKTGRAQDVPEPRRLWGDDALQLTPERFADTPLSIIVGNPPFGAAAGGEQMANQFLLKALELLAPGGFLGMVMPGSFLKMRRQKAGPVRSRLLDMCELMEVWEQPLQTIGLTARQETCVIIARKRRQPDGKRAPALFKATYSSQSSAVRALRDELRSTWTFAASGAPGRPGVSWRQDRNARIIASPIDAVWRRLDLERNLSSLSVSGTGIDAPLSHASFSEGEVSGYFPYLRSQKRLRPFLILAEDWKNDPDPQHNYLDPSTAFWPKKRLWPLYEGPKIVIRCDTNRNARLQIAAAFDDASVFPDHHFRCVGLRAESALDKRWAGLLAPNLDARSVLLWLTAVLNSPVAHAWVATCSPPRGLLEVVLDTLPLPSRFDPAVPKLVERTRDPRRSTTDDLPVWTTVLGGAQDDFMRLAAEINDRVLASYGLGNEDIASLANFLKGMTEPWVDGNESAHLPNPGITYRRITGKVFGVDVTQQTVTLDLPRYSRRAGQPITIPLPKHMPGWALRDGVEFTCLVPASRRAPDDLTNPWLLREFRALPYSYLEPAEIERMAGYRNLEATP
jgi:hypothetical protein